jgi:hypothetical protein
VNRLTRIDLRQIGLVGIAAATLGILSGAWGLESSYDVLDQEPKFVLSDRYPHDPRAAAPGESPPWRGIEFGTENGARDYLFAVLRYVIEGNEETFDPALDGNDRPWQVEVNGETRWYHVPWMHYGSYGREGVHGLTRERDIRLDEVLPPVADRPNDRFQSWAVSFYNPPGGYTIGRVWPPAAAIPEPANAQFEEHTVAVKLLFTAASEQDIPYLKGAPSWRANVHKFPSRCRPKAEDSTNCEREVGTVRLIQIDVAVKDDRAERTGWVFGTFVFNGHRSSTEAGAIVPTKRLVDGESVWNQLEPVGLMWGNDPNARSGADLRETLITKNETSSVFQHLGCLDRLNGPVDNPAASCMACHALARFPAPEADNFPMAFPACGGTSVGDDGRIEAVSAAYFRNLSGGQVIDDLDGVELPDGIELPEVNNLAEIKALDYSLQLSFGMINFCNFWKDQDYTQAIEDFCQWDTEQLADDQAVIGDRILARKAALVPNMPRQSR